MLEPRPHGHVVEVTWGEVKVGDTVLDKTDRMHFIEREDQQHLRLLSAHPSKESWMIRPPDDRPVRVYRPSEEEALILLQDELGARLLRDIEEREHTLARRLNIRVEPTPRRVQALRDHLLMLHAINVDDVQRQHKGTEANPSTPKVRKAKIDELCALHDEAHDDPDTWPHAIPHYHEEIP